MRPKKDVFLMDGDLIKSHVLIISGRLWFGSLSLLLQELGCLICLLSIQSIRCWSGLSRNIKIIGRSLGINILKVGMLCFLSLSDCMRFVICIHFYICITSLPNDNEAWFILKKYKFEYLLMNILITQIPMTTQIKA